MFSTHDIRSVLAASKALQRRSYRSGFTDGIALAVSVLAVIGLVILWVYVGGQ